MSESPEIPEAEGPYGKQVAITIAIMAVALTVIQNRADDAKTDAILKTNEASNQWGYFQAKSLKQHLCETEARMLTLLQPAAEASARAEAIRKAQAESKRYDGEKESIKAAAEKLMAIAAEDSRINDRCDKAALGIQIGIVTCSVAILSGWRAFWIVGIVLGSIGAAIAASAYLM